MAIKDRIKIRKHFLFLGIIPSIVFLVLVIFSISWMQEIYTKNMVQSSLNHAYHMFYGELYEEAKLINVLTERFTENKEVQNAFLAEDRDELLTEVRPVFQTLRADHEITHCYFYSLDKKVFLRGHYPKLFGDEVKRFTLTEAESTGLVNYGLELGRMGTLTLRVVIPWRVADRVIGYIELGKEIKNVLHEMKKILEMDLVLIVNKQHLDKERWGSGEYGGGIVVSDWDQYPEVVVFGMTMDKKPPIIGTDLALPHQEHKDLILEAYADGRQLLAGFAPLLDASDRDIGDIIIIKDFTEMKTVANRLNLFILSGYFICVLLYMIFVFLYLRRAKVDLKEFVEAGEGGA